MADLQISRIFFCQDKTFLNTNQQPCLTFQTPKSGREAKMMTLTPTPTPTRRNLWLAVRQFMLSAIAIVERLLSFSLL
jgi:hypothetical protein